METLIEKDLKQSLTDLKFINTAVNTFDIDENPQNKPRQIVGKVYSKVTPTPRENPRLVCLSEPALKLLDLSKEGIEKDPKSALYLTGNEIIPGSVPISHNYCGHQFGVFAGQLGDGRAITLGDIKNQDGELWELQLKGSGVTPYSRFADGKAVLRSSIREFLCSEALWALGIPTTRAASLTVTDSLAERDPFYEGDKIMEKCAVVMRLAPSFWRFGSFEIFKPHEKWSGSKGPSHGLEKELMPKMLDFVLDNYYPEISKAISDRNEAYLEMYSEIVRRTARLVALWQCYGFCHGVLNTDNMSILGLTIDFGPYGWMDYFDEDFICNHSDEHGRYSYKNQPEICKWNLKKLSEALAPIVDEKKTDSFLEENYDKIFKEKYYSVMRQKLGLIGTTSVKDEELIDDLFKTMQQNASDFTNTFRALANVAIPKTLQQVSPNDDILQKFAELSPPKESYAARYKGRYSEMQFMKIKILANSNPYTLMMMGIDPDIIEREEEKMKKHKEIMSQKDEDMKADFQARWKKWLEKYMLRLFFENSSVNIEEEGKSTQDHQVVKRFDSYEQLSEMRKAEMNKVNPIYVVRNYMAEEAIRKAEKEDFSGVENLLKMVLDPFTMREEIADSTKYSKCPPPWASTICVSCSS